MSSPVPGIGSWYQALTGEMMKVVAWDPDGDIIEVQFYDGTIEEYDTETWEELRLSPIEPPEDWSGSLDLTPEDYGVDPDSPAGEHQINPFDELDLND